MKSKPSFFKRLSVASRFLFSGYDAAKWSRLRGRNNNLQVRPEEAELDAGDRERVVAKLLDLRRNNSLVQSLCRLRETDVIGAGIIPRAKSGDDETDARLEELWAEYSESPELTQTLSMREVQQQLASLTMIFGDGGLFLHKSGRVQLVEGDRIGEEGGGNSIFRNPMSNGRNGTEETNRRRIIEGVEINAEGRPIAYHIGHRDDAGGLVDVRRVIARNFIFHRKLMRPNQLRGIPQLASVVPDLTDVGEYDEIEMVGAKVAASLAAVVKRDGATDFELAATAAGDDQSERLETFEPGRFHYLEPDEDISVINSSGRPNSDAISYLEYRLRKIGASIGIPLEFLLMTIGDTSFSASQGMVLLYQATTEATQRDLYPVLSRWWRWRVGKWIKDGEIEVPERANPFRVQWQPPSFRWINRAAQVKADAAYLTMGALSLDDITATFGSTAGEAMEKKAKNISLARILAEEHGLDDWRDLFNPLTTYANVNLIELMNAQNGEPEV
jgi:lambda family phage portal protein